MRDMNKQQALSYEFFEKLREIVKYVEDLQLQFRFAQYHILMNIDKFSIEEIECMFLDHIFTGVDRERIVIDLLKLGRVNKEKARELLFTTEEEFEKILAKYQLKT